MFSFDGNYRRTPVQSLGGASRNSDRMTLIKKAAEERLKRAEIRRQNDGALRIQAYVRSFIRRQKVKAEQRRLFDQMIAKTGGVLNEETLHLALQRILFFYYNKSTADGERLVFYFLLLLMFFVKLFFFCQQIVLGQFIIKSPGFLLTKAVAEPLWKYRLKRFLFLCTHQICHQTLNQVRIFLITISSPSG